MHTQKRIEHTAATIEEIYALIRSKSGNCEVNLAPFAVYLNADTSIYVEPDIFVICDKSKIDETCCKGAACGG